MARARTHDGRNSCSSAMTEDTVAVQAYPHTTSNGSATHAFAARTSEARPAPNTMAAMDTIALEEKRYFTLPKVRAASTAPEPSAAKSRP